jgi:DNA invertase Pin-like site-specific DNA recombinase
MTKAFGYVRVSGKGQMNGDGPERQESAIRQYAKTHGIELTRVFVESGVSSETESMDRPAWSELMTALHSNGTRAVIVEKLDRLARDLMVQESAIAHMKRDGYELISTQEPDLMATDPTRVLFRQMMGAFAQYEKNQIVIKLRAARNRKKAQTGERMEGQKPFGIDAREVAVIERIRSLRANDASLDYIANTLNSEGVTTRRGKTWHASTANGILKRTAR